MEEELLLPAPSELEKGRRWRGESQAAGGREVAARGDVKFPICKGEGSYL
jgi:hypothetical protein